MALATRTVLSPNYYGKGWIYGGPVAVIIHASRSGQYGWTHAKELGVTIRHFQNPASYASAQWVLSPTERVRMVRDECPSWHAVEHSWQSYGIELTQPTIDTPFEDGHYENLVLVCAEYARLGIPVVRLDTLEWGQSERGFTDHEHTAQGQRDGKTDVGPLFDWARFFAMLKNAMQAEEDDMAKPIIIKTKGTARYVLDKNSLMARLIPSQDVKQQLREKGLVEPGVEEVSEDLLRFLKQ